MRARASVAWGGGSSDAESLIQTPAAEPPKRSEPHRPQEINSFVHQMELSARGARSNDQFEPVQSNRTTIFMHRSANDPHPAPSARGGLNLCIQGESAPVSDCITAKPLQRRP